MSFQRIQDIKQTRKDHVCEGCLQKIKVGSHAKYLVGVFEGDFSSVYLCIPCHDFWDGEHADIFLDGWFSGDIGEARRVYNAKEA